MTTEWIVVLEISAVWFFFVVMGLQRPGVKSVGFARKYGVEGERSRILREALDAAQRFSQEYPFADKVYHRALIVFVGGLGIVFAATPGSLSPHWINTSLTTFGFLVQAVSAIAFYICGIWRGRYISRTMRSVDSPG